MKTAIPIVKMLPVNKNTQNTLNEFAKKCIDEAYKPEIEKFMAYVEKQIEHYHGTIDSILFKEVINNCTPPIKGDITKGKIKWRGLYLAIDHENKVAFYQRGKRISSFITSDGEIIN